MDFATLPPGTAQTGPLTLNNVTIPACLLGRPGDLIRTSLSLADGRITATQGTPLDMKGAMLFPTFTDMHTHLDKGHIWPRAPNPDGTFMGALDTVGADRTAHWTAEDVAARMEFSLQCAYAHGTSAIRTHLDSIAPQDAISFPVFAAKRAEWAGRITLQAACLIGAGDFSTDGAFRNTADIVAASGGVLGMVTYPMPDIRTRITQFFAMATARGLSADFHVDETLDPASNTLRAIAEAVLETGFPHPVAVGHCCSVSAMAEAEALHTLDLVAKAKINVVSLPMCNLYLQDRQANRTPRRRGVTLVHEMKARGINLSFASDNTRDPFYAYGDMDMLELMREATRIAHLDHTGTDWPLAFTANPARAMALPPPSLAPGAPADLVIFKARTWTELFARPQSDRIVIRAGRQITRHLPDYATLDPLMESQ